MEVSTEVELKEKQQADENRSFDRKSLRTAAVAISLNHPKKVFRAWTDDLSASGVRILCEEHIDEPSFFLRIMLPELRDQFFEVQTVRSELSKISSFGLYDRKLIAYGVRFLRPCTADESAGLQEMVEQADAS